VFKAEGRRQKAEISRATILSAFCFLLSAFLNCHREQRDIAPTPASAQRVLPVRVGGLQPGPKQLGATALQNPYEGNAYAISEGQRLFEQYNCAGCHFHGGGGIGPALMDEEWLYGSSPANIYTTIAEGRPNGMPSYGGHIPDYQIWQLTSYVRSVGGLVTQVASQPRSDAMMPRRAEEPKRRRC
jgi:cytochrome c oxidase cbb3-type subunit 3